MKFIKLPVIAQNSSGDTDTNLRVDTIIEVAHPNPHHKSQREEINALVICQSGSMVGTSRSVESILEELNSIELP